MRWLIVGPYPPEQGSGPAAAAAFVAERLAAGDTVVAVSPRPSAAHLHRPLVGGRAMGALARLARAEGVDGLWLRVEPGILLRSGRSRREALVDLLALSALLRTFRTRVLDVGDVGLLPGGRAGRVVFSAATRFVTYGDAATATLIANGAPLAKVEQRDLLGPSASAALPSPRPAASTTPVDYPPATVLGGLAGTRDAIEAAVNARAAELASARAVPAATEELLP